MTRIAILKTGAPPPALADSHGDYPAMFEGLLGDAFATTTFDVQAGEWPDPVAFDGAIITGSAAGVYEDDVWIGALLDWIRSARGQTKLVGVCFGHQALAQALGGRVEKSERGWGVGLHRYQVVSEQDWMAPAAATVAIPVSHQDQVVAIPAEARVLLRSDFTPHAGLIWGEDAISFQGHPEFVADYAQSLLDIRRETYGESLYRQASASLDRRHDGAVIAQWMLQFVAQGRG
ncbi:MAG: type 1 glutamine amidotransferase [Brevundimonas sp.]|nr:type 1 glutamine amidotransferase [Brevundimonas sp.]